MRWLRKRRPAPQDPEPPEGIILRARGRDIRCIPLRDPDQDEPGCAAWLAVPAEDFLLRRGEEFDLFVADPPDGYLPDNCVILPGFTIPGAGVEAWPGPR
jgi:hypothetical protein